MLDRNLTAAIIYVATDFTDSFMTLIWDRIVFTGIIRTRLAEASFERELPRILNSPTLLLDICHRIERRIEPNRDTISLTRSGLRPELISIFPEARNVELL